MDPYLEGPVWSDFHHGLATEIKCELQPQLLPRYYATTSTYFLVGSPDSVEIAENLYPDVGVVREPGRRHSKSAVAVVNPPLRARLVLPHPVPHSQVEIRDVQNRRLVTAIEFLSPVNKREPGRTQYLRKRLRILHSHAHLLEVDLLRRGRRLPWNGKLPPASYYVFLSRANERPEIGIWPMALSDPLPKVPVPLLKGDPDVLLDLQQALTAVYDLSHYDQVLNYRSGPNVPLTVEEAKWANRLLKENGYRK
jgi:hypothetical protein